MGGGIFRVQHKITNIVLFEVNDDDITVNKQIYADNIRIYCQKLSTDTLAVTTAQT